MKLILSALRHPITIFVSVIAILFFSSLAIRNSKIDIFPKLSLPTVYVAQPYGGLSPDQMEGFITSYYEYHFLYITGVKYVDSKSIQGAALIKIEFNEGTDMSQAMAEVVGYVNRARAFMPPGTVPPFITRFDAGNIAVGQLVFSSDSRTLSEISDLALFRVRPMFSTLPGVSAPPPIGGNQKTVVITVDPQKLQNYHLSPDQVVQSLAKFNTITPAGSINIGDTSWLTPQNSLIDNIQDLQTIPLRLGSGPSVYLRDIANITLGADITTGYVLINGKRSVYIPVTRRSDASTWDVVQRVKAALPDMQAEIPDDIKVSFEFDQSGYVINSLKSLLFEGGLGALLTGLVVWLFLRDIRSSLIVIMTIPLSLLSAMTGLYLCGQTINIMTLGGLALSVGILVDEATVTIEHIHRHLEMGKAKARAIIDACFEIALPKLLILFGILAVFVPALFMTGIPRAMFLPLSLAVGFAVITSFLLSQSFVPVVSNWLLKDHTAAQPVRSASPFDRFRDRYIRSGHSLKQHYKLITILFLAGSLTMAVVLLGSTGTALFPDTDSHQATVRLRLPVGTRFERTEDATHALLALADSITGKGNVEISSAFAGTQPSSFPVSLIHLWTSGPNESVTRIKLKPGTMRISDFKDRLRSAAARSLPGIKLSFEPGDLVEQVLNLGSNNPVEIAIVNRNLEMGKKTADTLLRKLSALPELRDLQIATPLAYPTIQLNIDRVRAGQLGLSGDEIARSTVAATSSSRFTTPNYWLDRSTGTAYQVQVQYPGFRMNSTAQLEAIPVSSGTSQTTHTLSEIASWKRTTVTGEYDRLNQQRYITITANIVEKDRGGSFARILHIIESMGKQPNGARILLRGQDDLLQQTISSLQSGIVIAIIVIFLTMTIFFQSFRVALASLSIIPAVIAGSTIALFLTGNTLNIQSYMGTIMAIGVAIANSVLFVTSAEKVRRSNLPGAQLEAAANRLRPILMTSLSMIAGMIPMALGLSEGSDQTAPLGIAVIGGLLSSAISVLFFLPHTYHWIAGNKPYRTVSMLPENFRAAGPITNILLPALACLVLLLQSCDHPTQAGPAVSKLQDSSTVFILHPDTIKKSIELSGELYPHLQTDLFARVQGYLREIRVDIGDQVHKGQTLAVIEAPEINTQVAQSEATLAAARSKLTASADRYQRLCRASQSESPGIVAPADIVSAHDQMAADSAAYEALRQQSKSYKQISGYLHVNAPFDGIIISRKADPGALVTATSMLLTIQDNKTLRLRISVPEIYVASATTNRELSFAVDAYPQQKFIGVPTRRTGTIDPATRTEIWEYQVDNHHQFLKAGAYVSAHLDLERSQPSLILPPSAILTNLERKFVIKVHDNKVQWVDVRQGMTTDRGIEVFGDLRSGDTLVLKATDERKPGTTAYWTVKRS